MRLVADSSQKENLRIRLDGVIKERWDQMLARKRISQQDAIEALVLFCLSLDDLAQSVVLAQITEEKDRTAAAKLALSRIAGDSRMKMASKLK